MQHVQHSPRQKDTQFKIEQRPPTLPATYTIDQLNLAANYEANNQPDMANGIYFCLLETVDICIMTDREQEARQIFTDLAMRASEFEYNKNAPAAKRIDHVLIEKALEYESKNNFEIAKMIYNAINLASDPQRPRNTMAATRFSYLCDSNSDYLDETLNNSLFDDLCTEARDGGKFAQYFLGLMYFELHVEEKKRQSTSFDDSQKSSNRFPTDISTDNGYHLKAADYYLMSAKQGNELAKNNLNILTGDQFERATNYELGVMFEDRKYFTPNPQLALTYFENAAVQNDPNALYRLGKAHLNGDPPLKVEQYESKGIAYLMQSCILGNLEAAKLVKTLGLKLVQEHQEKPKANGLFSYFVKDEDCPKEALDYLQVASFANDKEAKFTYLTITAKEGNLDSWCQLAQCAVSGELVPHLENSLQKAEEYYLKAVEKGDAQAEFELANLYLTTDLIPFEFHHHSDEFKHLHSAIEFNKFEQVVMALTLYASAAKTGHSASYRALVNLHYQLLQITIEEKTLFVEHHQALDVHPFSGLSEEGARNKHVDTLAKLSQIYASPNLEELYDRQKAKHFSTEAADQGHRISALRLAEIYKGEYEAFGSSITSPSSGKLALNYFKIAADGGDYHDRIRYLRFNAELGDMNSAFEVGDAYRKGNTELKLGKDDTLAEIYLTKAADQGHLQAALALADFYEIMPEPKLDLALKYYTIAGKLESNIVIVDKIISLKEKLYDNSFMGQLMNASQKLDDASKSDLQARDVGTQKRIMDSEQDEL